MTISYGTCLCGAVQYQVNGPLRNVIACHCNQCRKTSGHYVAASRCQTGHLSTEGTVKWYRSSETAQRGFCPECGSNLFWRPDKGDQTSIFAGTLSDARDLIIESQMHVATKGSYYDLPDVPVVEQKTNNKVD